MGVFFGSGRYQAVNALQGVKDFIGQVLPSPEERAGGLLLRRAKDYEVWRAEVGAMRCDAMRMYHIWR